MPKNRIAAIILAAGSSSRMGVSKQLLAFQETTLLGHVIENVRGSDVDKMYCTLGAESDLISLSIERYTIETIVNSNYKTGLSSSIIASIRHIENESFDAVMMILGDQPLVDSIYINELLTAFNNSSDKIIASSYANGPGVPVIIPKKYYPNLLQLKDDKGAKEFLTSQNENIISFETDSLFDVDTEEDYKKLIKRLGKKA